MKKLGTEHAIYCTNKTCYQRIGNSVVKIVVVVVGLGIIDATINLFGLLDLSSCLKNFSAESGESFRTL